MVNPLNVYDLKKMSDPKPSTIALLLNIAKLGNMFICYLVCFKRKVAETYLGLFTIKIITCRSVSSTINCLICGHF